MTRSRLVNSANYIPIPQSRDINWEVGRLLTCGFLILFVEVTTNWWPGADQFAKVTKAANAIRDIHKTEFLFFTFSTRNGLEDHGCPQLPLVSAASHLGISWAPVNTEISPNKSPSGLPSRAIEPDLSGEIGWAMRLFRGLPQARCDQPP
jgi:hypothetical protein